MNFCDEGRRVTVGTFDGRFLFYSDTLQYDVNTDSSIFNCIYSLAYFYLFLFRLLSTLAIKIVIEVIDQKNEENHLKSQALNQ